MPGAPQRATELKRMLAGLLQKLKAIAIYFSI